MKVPHHTDQCREGWGCRAHCPVLIMTKEYEALLQALRKAQGKEPDND